VPAVAATASFLLIVFAIGARRRHALAVLLAAAAAFCAGAALSSHAWRESASRRSAVFHDENPIELTLMLRIISAAERDREGGRHIRAATEGPPGALSIRLEVVDVPGDDAARLDALRRGDLVRVWCRLRAPSGGPMVSAERAGKTLAADRLDATARVKSSRLVTLVAAGAWSPARALDDARARGRRALDAAVGPSSEARAVLGAMLLNDRYLVDADTDRALRDSGLVHILSISGLHTALTIVLVLTLLRSAGLGATGLLVCGVCAVVVFSQFVGHGAPVWRACAGLAAGLAARWLGRDVDPLAALALAAGVLVAAVPPLAWSIGFVLSVTATAGLLAACSNLHGNVNGPSLIRSGLAASWGAYVATVPFLALTFGRAAPAGLVANLAAAPLCAACLASGAGAIVFAAVPVAGPTMAALAKLSAAALMAVARWAATIPAGHFRIARPGSILVASYVALLVVTWLSWPKSHPALRRAIRLASAFVFIALHLGPPPPGPGPAGVSVLDVGQGLAVVLRGEDGRFLLVDAGPAAGGRFDSGDRIVIPALVDRGCRRLSVLAISHGHDDHAGGALAVIRDLDVGELWIGAGTEHDPGLARLADLAVARGVAVRRLGRGASALRAGFHVSVPHPGPGDRTRPVNDRCLVLRAETSTAASILLPGDLEAEGERAILSAPATIAADALIAPHHGADGSSTAEFLRRVSPRLVIVSAGAQNRFGHPGASALVRFADAKARVLRTDRDGTIDLSDCGGAWRALADAQGHRDEREHEDERQEDTHRFPPGAERLGFIEQPGMAVPQDQEDQEPERVGGGRRVEDDLLSDQQHEADDRHPRKKPMKTRREGEDRVAPVELADGEKVHRGDQHPDPRRAVDGIELELRASVKQLLEIRRAERAAEKQPVSGRPGNLGRPSDTRDEERKGDRESGDRSGGRDVEQRPPGRDHAANSDDGAQRPDEHGGSGDEKRQRGGNTVIAAGEVVAHLVGAQDQQQKGSVRETVRQPGGIEKLTPPGVVVPHLLPKPASRGGRGRECGEK
jgi:competence protein ComEC